MEYDFNFVNKEYDKNMVKYMFQIKIIFFYDQNFYSKLDQVGNYQYLLYFIVIEILKHLLCPKLAISSLKCYFFIKKIFNNYKVKISLS